jgi:hypothetical protein
MTDNGFIEGKKMKNKVIATFLAMATILVGCSSPALSTNNPSNSQKGSTNVVETSDESASLESSIITENSSKASSGDAVFGITRSTLYMNVFRELIDNFGMSEEDLKAFLDESGYDFDFQDIDGYHVYFISDPDREGMRLFMDCICDGDYEGDTSGEYFFYDMFYQDRNGHEEFIQLNGAYWMDDYEYETWCYARITSKDGATSNLTTIDFDSLDEMERYFFIMD